MARGLLREVGRQPDWRLTWMDGRGTWGAPTGDLAQRLLAPVDAGDPGSPFIFPTMSLVERTGLAADLLDAPTRRLPAAPVVTQSQRSPPLSLGGCRRRRGV